MAEKTRVDNIDGIPFNNLIVGREYLLSNATPEILAEAQRRLAASRVAINRRALAVVAPGYVNTIRIIVWPNTKSEHGKDGGAFHKTSNGRPPSALTMALAELDVGKFVIASRRGTDPQAIRTTAYRLGKKMGWKFSVETAGYNDKRMEWTEAMKADYTPDDFFIIERTE